MLKLEINFSFSAIHCSVQEIFRVCICNFDFPALNTIFIDFFFFWLRRVFVALRVFSLVAVSRGFSCCGPQTPGAWASVVVTCGLSCSMACGVFPG